MVLKVKINKLAPPGFANSSRARCAIYSRDTAIRIYSVSQLKSKNPRSSKSHHGPKLWASQNIFAGHYLFGFFRIWPYPRQNPM
jgi:hypothetical protein